MTTETQHPYDILGEVQSAIEDAFDKAIRRIEETREQFDPEQDPEPDYENLATNVWPDERQVADECYGLKSEFSGVVRSLTAEQKELIGDILSLAYMQGISDAIGAHGADVSNEGSRAYVSTVFGGILAP